MDTLISKSIKVGNFLVSLEDITFELKAPIAGGWGRGFIVKLYFGDLVLEDFKSSQESAEKTYDWFVLCAKLVHSLTFNELPLFVNKGDVVKILVMKRLKDG